MVQERKTELQRSGEGEIFSYATALAGHISLARDQHAEWGQQCLSLATACRLKLLEAIGPR